MSSASPIYDSGFTGSLSKVVDEHIKWFVNWHRMAFNNTAPRAEQVDRLGAPSGFSDWYKSAMHGLPHDQPVMDKLAVMHDDLHKLARAILLKTPDGRMPEQQNYEDLARSYEAFMRGLRQLERAFAVAASGIDPLTGLRSRVGMHEELEREQGRLARGGKPFCLAIMDIDKFKSINDTHGHEAGDRVLVSVAGHVIRSLRVFDDAWRSGGEEFLLCLKDADLDTGIKVLERLRSCVEEMSTPLADGIKIKVTASFGIIEASTQEPLRDLLRRADQALYRAKNEGRNRIVPAIVHA